MLHSVTQTVGHVQPPLVFTLDLHTSHKPGPELSASEGAWPAETPCALLGAGHFALCFLGLGLSGPIQLEDEAGRLLTPGPRSTTTELPGTEEWENSRSVLAVVRRSELKHLQRHLQNQNTHPWGPSLSLPGDLPNRSTHAFMHKKHVGGGLHGTAHRASNPHAHQQ